MASLRFKITVDVTNPDALPEMAARAKDFRPVFERVIKEWAKLNEQKFSKGRGVEAVGAQIDDVHWLELKPETSKRKRQLGYPDAIMHATGALEESLTDPDMFFSAMTNLEVAFGTPMDAEDQMKVDFNWRSRQTIFLGYADQNMIRENVEDYLRLGPGYRDIKNAQGAANEAAGDMDMDFQDRFNVEE